MPTSAADMLIVIAVVASAGYGWWFGLIRTAGAFLGLVFGIQVASANYERVFSLIAGLFARYPSLGRIFVYVMIYGLVNRLVDFVFAMVDKALVVASFVPFYKLITRLLGSLLGVLLGLAAAGIAVILAESFFPSWSAGFLAGSEYRYYAVRVATLVFSLWPWLIQKYWDLWGI